MLNNDICCLCTGMSSSHKPIQCTCKCCTSLLHAPCACVPDLPKVGKTRRYCVHGFRVFIVFLCIHAGVQVACMYCADRLVLRWSAFRSLTATSISRSNLSVNSLSSVFRRRFPPLFVFFFCFSNVVQLVWSEHNDIAKNVLGS